jgi:hypothetical protein
MKKLILILSFLGLLPPASSWAQTLPPNEAGVAMGALHMYVHDVEAEKKVWITMGGTPIKVDGTDVVKFPGVLVFLTPGSPFAIPNQDAVTGRNSDNLIEHVGFYVVHGREVLAKWKAEGLKVILAPTPDRPDHGFVDTSDNLRLEIDEGKSQTLPITSDHIHFYLQEAAIPEAQAWYVKQFGAKAMGKNQAELPGIRLAWIATKSPTAVPVPTKGQTLDHIGFEVKNLEALSKSLAASGVKFDEPYSAKRHKSYSSATLTDPWGTSIELTEGLSKL